MTVSLAQITGAADALALQKLQAQMQMEAEAAAEAFRQQVLLHNEAQRGVARQTLDVMSAEASKLPSPDQEAFAQLFRVCMDARKVPLTSASTDQALADIMRDALYMATFAWPTYKAKLDELAA
jgi:hypothetical protein